MKKYTLYLTLLSMLVLVSCKKEAVKHESTLKLRLQTSYQGDIFTVPGVINDSMGNDIQLELIKTYIGQITLYPSDGGEAVILPGTYLFDQAEGDPVRTINEVPIDDYSSFSVSIAVDSVTNATKLPADFPDGNALGVGANMHWDWNTGYIFFKYEGRMDTSATNVYDHIFIYHVGLDSNARSKTFVKTIKVADGQEPMIDLVIDLDRIFSPSGVNAKEESITHTMNFPALASKLADIQLAALELYEP